MCPRPVRGSGDAVASKHRVEWAILPPRKEIPLLRVRVHEGVRIGFVGQRFQIWTQMNAWQRQRLVPEVSGEPT